MRNFVPKRNNYYKLPHETYMMMSYLLRDYPRIKNDDSSNTKIKVKEAVENVLKELTEDYTKRADTYGTLDSMRAFYDYAYYSYMFARKKSDCGASKNAWGMFRSKCAYLLAEKLMLI